MRCIESDWIIVQSEGKQKRTFKEVLFSIKQAPSIKETIAIVFEFQWERALCLD
jgi:hypothetical protein